MEKITDKMSSSKIQQCSKLKITVTFKNHFQECSINTSRLNNGKTALEEPVEESLPGAFLTWSDPGSRSLQQSTLIIEKQSDSF